MYSAFNFVCDYVNDQHAHIDVDAFVRVGRCGCWLFCATTRRLKAELLLANGIFTKKTLQKFGSKVAQPR